LDTTWATSSVILTYSLLFFVLKVMYSVLDLMLRHP
jgi:hypothetical protein